MSEYTNKDLINYFKTSEKDPSNLKIGLEHEIMGFHKKSKKRIGYEDGIKPILEEFQKNDQWEPKFEAGNIIALSKDDTTITIEPGGQLELSVKPLKCIREIDEVLQNHREKLSEVCRQLDIQFFSIGYDPVSSLEEIPWMPKERYRIMKRYLHPLGDRVHHMMQASCSVQANFDYQSEENMAKMFMVANGLSPFMNIISASSPIVQGKLSGMKSKRTWAWRGIDPSRTGLVPKALQENYGYQDYIDYTLDVPMLILEMDDKIIDFSGENFREYFFSDDPEIEFDDWKTQLGVPFPVARIKRAIEVRCMDAGRYDMVMAFAAMWKGVFYHEPTLDKACDFIKNLGEDVVREIHQKGFESGYETKIKGVAVGEYIKEVFDICKTGARAIEKDGCSAKSEDSSYLNLLEEMIEKQVSEADSLISAFHQNQGNDLFLMLEQNGLSFT